ncbi:hypothetical protein WMY93_015928 [Mugilogobius chulae]|uniref:Uncharacterized protein n=1 Tax=Mugilogobius chulae TaxID=88201 RepID=A0AAW0NWB1_9GOBI
MGPAACEGSSQLDSNPRPVHECRMSITLIKAEGKTMLTVISDGDPLWSCPLLYHILATICKCPKTCTVSNSLRSPKKSSHSALGALQIMIGIISIGFGSILLNSFNGYYRPYYYYCVYPYYPVWLGTPFILFGITSILSDRFPHRCVVMLSVLLNLSGVGFAIKAIVMNSYMLSFDWENPSCFPESRNNDYDWDGYRTHTTTTISPEEAIIRRSCYESYIIFFYVQRSMFLVLTVLSVLELLVVISTAALSIKALKKQSKCSKGSTEAKRGRAYGKCEAHVDFLVILSELLLTKECRMSVTLTKAEGKTMLTVISDGDPLWSCPLLCQILTTICNCTGACTVSNPLACTVSNLEACTVSNPLSCTVSKPRACTVSNSLHDPKKSSHSALGALQIMIGIINIGFGSILLNSMDYSGYHGPYYYYPDMSYPVWLGTLFTVFGITSILSDRFPRRCVVVLSGLLNLSGVGFAIRAIVANSEMGSRDYNYDWNRYRTTLSPDEAIIRRSCSESYDILSYVQRSMFIVLTALSVLELLVVLSTAALSSKEVQDVCHINQGGGKTMLTVISDGDPLWSCPLLCQILATIFNCTGACTVSNPLACTVSNPGACTVSNSLRSPKKSSHSALGALQIMIGIINIGFGSILFSSVQYNYYYYDLSDPIWLGCLFTLFGVTSILCDRFPRRCVVVLSVLLNLSGVGFAIKEIVTFSSMLSRYWPWSSCLPYGMNDYYWNGYRTLTTTTQSPDEAIIRRSCSESYDILFYVHRSMAIVLTVLSVLELLVVISTAALSIKALKKQSKCSKGTPRSAPTPAGED